MSVMEVTSSILSAAKPLASKLSSPRVKYSLLSIIAISYYLYKQRQRTSKMSRDKEGPIRLDKTKTKVAVNAEFFRQLKFLLRICVPKWKSKTMFIVFLHSLFLVLRTYLSVVVAKLDGKLVKDLVSGNGKEFGKDIIYWFLIALPATYTNSMIRYLQSKFAIALRSSLTQYVHRLYMSNITYYKTINLDNRIDGADQLITADINRFSNALASLYSNLGKPILDLIIFNYQLGRSVGSAGMWALAVNYFITASVMRSVTPAFGKLAAEEARLEGDFRSAHSRLITNAEEIAFYNGASLELSILSRTYSRLIKHINSIYKIRIAYNMFEDFIIKYCWSAVGLCICSVPVFFPDWAGEKTRQQDSKLKATQQLEEALSLEGSIEALNAGVEEKATSFIDQRTGNRTQGFITNKRLMISLADAGGRIMYSYKELSELAGYTYRVYNLIRVLQDLHDNKYVKPQDKAEFEYSLEDIQGTIEYHYNGIKFDHTPIVTPNGDTVLVRDLSLHILPGDHLMITGPNGSGKTSILRTLAGLWPLFRGNICRPEPGTSSIFYIPQRPYLVMGTLRDQLIYPHTKADMEKAGRTDAELTEILNQVYLGYILEREGGYGVVKEWKDVFSGGEKQRVQLARLMYHRPRFAILDEATSAVSNDVEALLYAAAKDINITLITISHRPTLFKYHSYLLRVGEGKQGDDWIFERIGTSEDLRGSVEAEIKKLESILAGTEGLRQRLIAINKELKLEIKVGSGGRTELKDSKDGQDLRHAKRTLV